MLRVPARGAPSRLYAGPPGFMLEGAMTTTIALLRGVNVGGKNKLRMEELRALCETLGLREVRSYIQSGNLVFRTSDDSVGARLERELETAFGIRTAVVTRTVAQLREVARRDPFPGVDPKKVVVFFLGQAPTPEAAESVRKMAITPETVHILGSEMFIYFPQGQGVSKLPVAKIEKTLATTGTGRNWNSVLALLAIAEEGEEPHP